MTDSFRLIPLDQIKPSPTNPRRTFDPAKLAELAASIKEKGVLQPVLVRPLAGDYAAYVVRNRSGKALVEVLAPDAAKDEPPWQVVYLKTPKGEDPVASSWHDKADAEKEAAFLNTAEGKQHATSFELVAGERRYRASKLAGVAAIPALVRDLDDRAVLEVQVVENDQREDVAPLEQAEGYKALVAAGYDVPAIAAKIGRSPNYVYSRLALADLVEPLRGHLRAGYLPFAHATLLARLPAASQDAVVRDFGWQLGIGEHPDHAHECEVSVADLRGELRHRHAADLKAATWKLDDAELGPAAGACSGCPKRTGARPGLFDELLNGEANAKRPPDLCLDTDCFEGKRAALVQLNTERVREKHGVEPVKVSDTGWHDGRSGATMSRYDYDIVPAKAAKGDPTAKPAVIVHGNDIGKQIFIRPKPKQKAASTGHGRQMDEWNEKRRVEGLIEQAVAFNAATAVAEGRVPNMPAVWQVLGEVILPQVGQSGRKVIQDLLAAAKWDDVFEAFAKGEAATRVCVLVAVACYRLSAAYDYGHEAGKRLLELCEVDPKKVRRQVEAAAKKQREAKKAKKRAKAKA